MTWTFKQLGAGEQMPLIPVNFLNLHSEEERLRGLALQSIAQAPELLIHLDMTHRSMDVLDMLRQHYTATDDERAISHLAIRVFNSFSSAIKLCMSGYYQSAVMVLRDVIETSELVEFFQLERHNVTRWREADRDTLVKKFGPGKIRKALDSASGLGKSKREAIYRKFSHLAAHPSADGFAMLRPKGLDSQCGPFPDVTALRAVLEEMGELAVRAGFAFAIHLDSRLEVCQRANLHFLREAMDFAEHCYGRVYSAEERADVERIFSQVEDLD